MWRTGAAVEARIRVADCREGGACGTEITCRTGALYIGGIGATAGSAVQTWIRHSAQIESRAACVSTKQCHTIVAWTCAAEITCQIYTGASIQTRITCAIVDDCAAVNTFFNTTRINKFYYFNYKLFNKTCVSGVAVAFEGIHQTCAIDGTCAACWRR